MITNRKFTNTTLWMLPLYNLPTDEYKKIGFINAYSDDENQMYLNPVCLLLFGETDVYGNNQGDLVTLFDDLVLDVYTYPQNLTVVALKIPEDLLNDYELITEGHYSQLSDKYRELVGEKVWARVVSNTTHSISKEKRLQLQIIDKDQKISELTGLSPTGEVWEKFNRDEEVLTNDIINHIIASK